MRRVVACALACVALLAACAPSAWAHASLLAALPKPATTLPHGPARVVLKFSEPVEILRSRDVSVVDERGRSVASGRPRTDPRNASVIVIALKERLLPDSYTVRYRVLSADSHTVTSAFVFALTGARLGPPVLKPIGGLSETGSWAVGARVAELIALGLLFALLAFRWLVWRPALERATGLDAVERTDARLLERRVFWRAFWPCVILAGLAEALVLAAKSAVVYGMTLGESVLDPRRAYQLVKVSRFGDLIGWRGALLSLLVIVALWAWSREASDEPAAPRLSLAMAVLSALTLGILAAQGHASQAPVAAGSVLVDAVHLGAVAVWIGGLPALVLVLRVAAAALPDGGRALAATVLARFSKLAMVAVAVVVATGLLRVVAELTDPAQLWDTAYGRSVLMKTALLWPIGFLALRNRRLIGAMGARGRVPGAALRVVRRNVQTELAISLGVIVLAALLVAQLPGRG